MGYRKRRSAEERRELEQDALSRARGNFSMANYVPVIQEFMSRGIPMAEIEPKVNVFTYNAWRALGRQVRRGEHEVKITTFVPMSRKERDTSTGEERTIERSRPTTAVVFHISQTDPVESRELATVGACHDDPGYIDGGNYQ